MEFAHGLEDDHFEALSLVLRASPSFFFYQKGPCVEGLVELGRIFRLRTRGHTVVASCHPHSNVAHQGLGGRSTAEDNMRAPLKSS